MHRLTISLVFKLVSLIEFYCWLPSKPEQSLKCTVDGIDLEWSFPGNDIHKDARIGAWKNVGTRYLEVEASTEVSADLAEVLLTGEHDDERTADEYRQLGRKLHDVIVERTNRLLSYIRVRKQQYTVEDITPDSTNPGQFFLQHGIKAFVDERKVRFNPDRVVCISVTLPPDNTYIKKEEWPEIERFVGGQNRLPLAEILLASAFQHFSKGEYRNALVNAVTAFEVSLNDFALQGTSNVLMEKKLRLGEGGLKQLIAKVGVTASLSVVLPLIFSEEEISASDLALVRAAVEKRHHVVHNGNHSVKRKNLSGWLLAIKACCSTLNASRAAGGAHRRRRREKAETKSDRKMLCRQATTSANG